MPFSLVDWLKGRSFNGPVISTRRRESLRKEQEKLAAQQPHADKFYEVVTLATLDGRQYSATERKEIDQLMRQRRRLLDRLKDIEVRLATIQKDGLAIKKHCTASPDEIQAAVKRYKKKMHEAEYLVSGMEFGMGEQLRKAKAELRRAMK